MLREIVETTIELTAILVFGVTAGAVIAMFIIAWDSGALVQ